MPAKKYGNDKFWCYIEDKWDGKEVAIWKGPEDQEEVIARAVNKYEAKSIVDALLSYASTEDTSKFSNKELAFLEFVMAHCVEPYSTMASNAVLWNDWDVYKKLKSDFNVIYS
jgi:hypothetical protein